MPKSLWVVSPSDTDGMSKKEQAEHLAKFYAEECGFRQLPWMKREFLEYLNLGFEMDMLREVIHRTARAPRPSWAYLSAIISRCDQNGIYTPVKFITQRHDPIDLPY